MQGRHHRVEKYWRRWTRRRRPTVSLLGVKKENIENSWIPRKNQVFYPDLRWRSRPEEPGTSTGTIVYKTDEVESSVRHPVGILKSLLRVGSSTPPPLTVSRPKDLRLGLYPLLGPPLAPFVLFHPFSDLLLHRSHLRTCRTKETLGLVFDVVPAKGRVYVLSTRN